VSHTTLVLLSVTVLLAAFVQGSIGVGFALIAAPVFGLIAPEQLPVCVLLLMLPLNLYVVWRERSGLDLHSGSWIIAGRVVGTFAGLWVLVELSTSYMNVLIGVSTIVATVATLLLPAFKPVRSAYLLAGLVTGVTETATGIGGPPLALVYQHHPPPVMRSTIALCFFIGEMISLVSLWYAGLTELTQLTLALKLMPALFAGAVLSRVVHHRIDSRALRIFVMCFSIVSGLILLLRA